MKALTTLFSAGAALLAISPVMAGESDHSEKKIIEMRMEHGPGGDHMMREMDANKDGFISKDEFKPRRDDRFKKADGNGDGAVTLAEMQARADADWQEHQAEMAKMRKSMTEKMFAELDANKDGKVTDAELDARALGHFAKLDTNSDGKISKDEHKAGKKNEHEVFVMKRKERREDRREHKHDHEQKHDHNHDKKE